MVNLQLAEYTMNDDEDADDWYLQFHNTVISRTAEQQHNRLLRDRKHAKKKICA